MRDAGFTLIEVIVALAILVTVASGVVRLFALAIESGRTSRDRTMAVTLAASRLEELRSLAWSYELDSSGAAVARTDGSTDLSVDPPGTSGPGLLESPGGTLDVSTPPYVDYLDAAGQRVGAGSTPPPRAVYARRWAVRYFAGSDRLAALQVFVTTVRRVRGLRSPIAWTGEDALLATVVSRKGR